MSEQLPQGGITKVSVNFLPRSVIALEAAADLTGDTQTDTLNRSVQLYAAIVRIVASGRGYGELVSMAENGAKCRIEINRPWWRFW